MFALQRTLTFGYLGQRWTRTLLIVLSIALGVAMLVATRALAEKLTAAADNAVNPFTEGVDLLVDKGQTGVPYSLTEELRAVEGVKRVEPLVLGFVFVPDLKRPDGAEPDPNDPEQKGRFIQLVGVEIGEDVLDSADFGHGFIEKIEFRGFGLAEIRQLIALARALKQQGQALPALPMRFALVGKDLADKLPEKALKDGMIELHSESGAPTRWWQRPSPTARVPWVGTIHLVKEVQEKLGSNIIFMPLQEAARIAMPGRPDNVSRIGLTIADGYDHAEVTQRVRAVLNRPAADHWWQRPTPRNRGNVRTVEDSNQSVRDITKGLHLGFMLGGAGALVVGLFLVYNALSVSVAERRHDIGILRSMGATRGQIARLFLTEALMLGLMGTAVGLPLGYAAAWGLLGPVRRVLEELFNITLDSSARVPLTSLTIALAVAAGPLTAVLAALIPAMQAAREEPADAVRRVPVVVAVLFRVLHVGVTLLLLGAGLGCVLFRDSLPQRVGAYGGIVCILVGGLLATPLLAQGLARFLQPVFRRCLGLEGRLAADNLIRSPGRTGLVIAALAATGALMVQTAGFIHSTEVALLTWIDEKIAADLFVVSGTSATSAGLPMREKVGQKLRADPRVEMVLPVRGHQMLFRERIVIMLALDVDQLMQAGPDKPLAKTFQHFPELTREGTALVSENFAALHSVGRGDKLTLPGPDGDVTVEVLGTLQDYTWNRGTIIVNRGWFRKKFKDDQVDIFDVWLKDGVDRDEMAKDLEQQGWVKEGLLVVVTREKGRDVIVSMIRKLYGMLYAQQFIVGLVALLGVMSSLFISVLQRRRELGLLRAVGASRPQVLRSVLAEATLMSVIGGLIGFVVGLVLEWYVVRILLLDEAGWVFPMHVPWGACGMVFIVSVAAATLVGLWPAYNATRMRIPDAIAYE
jgi:putative ABC transport system permease protein